MTLDSSKPLTTEHAEDAEGTAVQPLTGDAYLESLRDGREVWIYGERVKDVTTHPAFRNSARSVARLYDALHDPGTRGALTTATDVTGGTFTHPFFRVPRSVADLRAARDAIAGWQRMTYGWMGRSPDYKASFLATLGADPDFYGPYGDNARAWYRRAQHRVLFLNHAIVHPPVDRHLPPDEVADVYVHIDEETDAGVVVSGAKVVATGSALTHHTFIAHVGPPLTDPALATVFIAPMDTPGLKLICRASYEQSAAATGSPFDYPLSSRLDENDAVIVFDRALIPWENVLVHRDVDRANTFLNHSGFLPRFVFHGAVRLAVKLDFLCGLLLRAVRTTGTDAFRGVQAGVGEALAWRHTVWALTTAMVEQADTREDGSVSPNLDHALAHRVLAPTAYTRIKDIIENHVGSSLIYLTSHADDFRNPQLRPYLDTYLRGAHGTTAEERVKLMKLLWDSIGSEFAGRHELYERLYGGSAEQVRVDAYKHAVKGGLGDELGALVDHCMSDYDLNGWTAPDLIDPRRP
ncbi:4-hydroxyphenylacetate 3-monooxygenase oxygenase component [Streptomyces sp. yr375]|uniref:4-hydroxyphenylacetate 3-hydroxylase N-terminal domain-containing protein n=1 Tax=Streptomyces sp. yr375 TaxID=1761906 RepID=UPI0008AF5E4B|nr:4-hydroxyphenylacetate 3-hydroxylase N-terminal domain-containing protein [Streptomyces sp. yr375]SEP69470.1 4-hydroxyphenylacetate 3-monooxygenase oxygenase component [Streptomyces sp. yr375]